MRPLTPSLLLIALLLAACASSAPGLTPGVSPSPANPALPPTATHSPPAQTAQPTAVSPFAIRPGNSLPSDQPLIAYQADSAHNKILHLANPAEGIAYEFSFPDEILCATPFLAGLSPDANYFVYFEGGWLETVYGVEHLRLSTPDLALQVIDLRSGERLFTAPLVSPSFPQDLGQVAETIKNDWSFTNFGYTFEDVAAATQEFLLDHIRRVAWSPDSSLLAFASQDPDPTSDLSFFSPESRSAWRISADPGHYLRSEWAPDSAALILVTSLYDRHAREDTTYLLSREGSLLTSFTSQVWFFNRWHDSTYGLLYGGTDFGDYFDLKTISSTEGTIHMLWEGSYADIAFSPDLSTFLISSAIPSAPTPSRSGLYLGRDNGDSLLTLSEDPSWRVAYWGAERFTFAASSIAEGTIGVTPDGERVALDDGYWKLATAPDGNFLAGYHDYHPSYVAGVAPGLRLFDGDGVLLESIEDINVFCVDWNAESSALAYQVENRLYLWEAASRLTSLVSDQLNPEACAFIWVRQVP